MAEIIYINKRKNGYLITREIVQPETNVSVRPRVMANTSDNFIKKSSSLIKNYLIEPLFKIIE